MRDRLQAAWKANRHWIAAGFLLASTLYLLLMFLDWRACERVTIERASALGTVEPAWNPRSLWRQHSLLPSVPNRHAREQNIRYQRGAATYIGGVVGGIPGGVPSGNPAPIVNSNGELAFHLAAPGTDSRQVVRTGSLQIVAANAARVSDDIRALGERFGGFVVSSRVSGAEKTSSSDPVARSAQIVLRVPASRFEQARSEIRKLAASVDEDTTEARDVTRESTDQRATLRNLRAEEAQYLAILKRAGTVKDVLAVTEKLSEVRGEIERLEAETRTLDQQVEMSLLTVAITSVVEAQVLGLQWRPLYEAKVSARDALAALADFADSFLALLMYLPVIALWTVLVLLAAKLAWLALIRLGRLLFPAFPLWKRRTAESA